MNIHNGLSHKTGHWGCFSNFLITGTKCLTKTNVSEEGFVLAHRLRRDAAHLGRRHIHWLVFTGSLAQPRVTWKEEVSAKGWSRSDWLVAVSLENCPGWWLMWEGSAHCEQFQIGTGKLWLYEKEKWSSQGKKFSKKHLFIASASAHASCPADFF